MTNIIAEVGLNHNGSFQKAKQYILEASKANVWGIKFQIHYAEFESTLEEKFRINFSKRFKSRYEYWQKTSFRPSQWNKLYNICKKKGLKFIISPFSVEAAKIIEKTGVDFWKIGSGEIYNDQLIDFLSQKKRKIIISSGMSNWLDLQKVYKKLNKKFSNVVSILQCTSMYPSRLEDVGLNVIDEIKKKFKCKSGLSDHSGTVYPALSVIAKNEDFLEIHVKINDKTIFPDKSSSISFENLEFLQDYNRSVKLLSKKIDKNKFYKKFFKMRKLFGRSLSLKKNFKKGRILTKEDLILKKPGSGLGIKYLNFFVGKKLVRNVFHNQLLKKNYVK